MALDDTLVTVVDVTGISTAVESTLVVAVVTGRADASTATLVTAVEVAVVTRDSTLGELATVECADLFVSMALVT